MMLSIILSFSLFAAGYITGKARVEIQHRSRMRRLVREIKTMNQGAK